MFSPALSPGALEMLFGHLIFASSQPISYIILRCSMAATKGFQLGTGEAQT
jgi:hypothetical protein